MAPSFLPEGQKVWIQSENGILGMGDYPHPDDVDPYVSLYIWIQCFLHFPLF